MIFSKQQEEELNKYLFESYIHDAQVMSCTFNCAKKELDVLAQNKNYNVEYHIVFKDVKSIHFNAQTGLGDPSTVLFFGLEENKSPSHFSDFDNDFKFCLCAIIQMFSNDEIHIAAEKIFLECKDK